VATVLARRAALGISGGGRDDLDLLEDALAGVLVRHQHERNAGGAQHGDSFLRAGVLAGEDERRIEAEHALRRQRPHVADVRLLAQRLRRVEARGIDGDHALLEAQRIEDLGNGTADRDDA
jgi:hypothetical protein